jgi:acyl CoA:acetate/3-ketoacid CoA transferase beta subunit
LKNPSSTAASAGKYELEIISGTASFIGSTSFLASKGRRQKVGIKGQDKGKTL